MSRPGVYCVRRSIIATRAVAINCASVAIHRSILLHWNKVSSDQACRPSFFRFKEALDQALRVRGSRDFSSRAAYERFVQDLVCNCNLTRASRQQEQAALRPLPRLPLAPCRELRVNVSRERSIQVLGKRYSVPSQLIGTTVLVQVRTGIVEFTWGHARY